MALATIGIAAVLIAFALGFKLSLIGLLLKGGKTVAQQPVVTAGDLDVDAERDQASADAADEAQQAYDNVPAADVDALLADLAAAHASPTVSPTP